MRWRLILGAAGLLLPPTVTVLATVADEAGIDLLFYPLLALHSLLTVPGWLLPFQGFVTLALVSLFWAAAGLMLGRWLDQRRHGE